VPQEPPVGRDSELGGVDVFLQAARERLHALAVTGAAGIGKSTVWNEGLRRAGQAGYVVLTARPSRPEARLAYAALADLVGPVEEHRLEGLPEVQRRALDGALLRAEVGPGRRLDARAVCAGLVSLLRALALSGPLLLAVDDAQWLDSATAAALAFAARRIDDLPVGVLVAVRAQDARPATFEGQLPADRRRELELGPLTVAALHEILKRELGQTFPRPVVVRIASATGGNPFYALEIARELVRSNAPVSTSALPVPREIRALARSRLARLPRRTEDALLAVSCLSRPTTALVDVDALGPAEQADVVRVDGDGRIRFSHPLLASGVYEAAPSAQRRRVHRALADAVDDPEERARQLALAADRPGEDVAQALDDAALLARARGAPRVAAELVELALRLSPDPASRPGRLLAAAGHHVDAGDLEPAERLVREALADAADGPSRAQALRLLAQVRQRVSSFGEAIEHASAALEAAVDDAALRTEIELDLGFYLTSVGDFGGAEPLAEAAVADATRAGDDALVAEALAVLTVIHFLRGRGLDEERLARALAGEDPQRSVPLTVRPRLVQGFLQLWTGRLAEAVETLERLRAEALEQGRESDVPMLLLYLAWAHVWQGNLPGAARLADEASETAAFLEDRGASAVAYSAAALVHAWQGRTDAAREEGALAASLFDGLGWRAGAIWPCWALGFLELSLGNPAGTDAVLGPLTGLLLGAGDLDPVLGLFMPDEIEALVELGDGDRASELLAWFEDRARDADRPWALAAAARSRGLLLLSRGENDAARAALEEARARYDGLGLPLERGRALLALGVTLRRQKKRRAARAVLEEALSVFAAVGAALWAERARGELARLPARRAPDGLTPTEEAIAGLAASGLTNRSIAERVFVSPKTVESNLARVYRKLGIRSRAELGRAMAERERPAET
jgi:DNA-binding CsgD family transcriptional regulator